MVKNNQLLRTDRSIEMYLVLLSNSIDTVLLYRMKLKEINLFITNSSYPVCDDRRSFTPFFLSKITDTGNYLKKFRIIKNRLYSIPCDLKQYKKQITTVLKSDFCYCKVL